MLALAVSLIVVSASPMNPHRERGAARAARLMTIEEREKLASLTAQYEDLRLQGSQRPLLVTSILTISLGAALPVGLAAVGLVGSMFVGLFGLLAPSLWNVIPAMWVGLFSWVPVWGWTAIIVVTVAGLVMMTGSLVNDAPRRERMREISLERRRMLNVAASRPDIEVMAPPLVTF